MLYLETSEGSSNQTCQDTEKTGPESEEAQLETGESHTSR